VGVEQEIAEAILSVTDLPTPRIRFIPGIQGSLILDAMHYYYPISIKSVLEVAKLSGEHRIVFTEDPDELKYLNENMHNGFVVNPDRYFPGKGDVVVLRGSRTHNFHKYLYLLGSHDLPLNEPLQSFEA
jgi:hypothetical protein